MNDPISGPISRERLKELAAAPFGHAAAAIRHYDPQWGRAEGEAFEWKVIVERDSADTGVAYIKAATQEEADKLADELADEDVEWDYSCGGIRVLAVEPNAD